MRREDEQESLHEFAQNFAARHAARDAAPRAPTAPESGDGRACQPAKAISADNVVRSGGEQDKGESLLEFARNFAARYAARGATRAPQALKRARLPLGVIAVNAAPGAPTNKCHKARPAVKQLPSPRAESAPRCAPFQTRARCARAGSTIFGKRCPIVEYDAGIDDCEMFEWSDGRTGEVIAAAGEVRIDDAPPPPPPPPPPRRKGANCSWRCKAAKRAAGP